MFTYVVSMEGSNFVKIGRTTNISLRMNSLQVSVPNLLRLECAFEGDFEKKLHKRFDSFNVRGEWFDISVDEIFSFATTKLGALPIKTNGSQDGMVAEKRNKKKKGAPEKYPFSKLNVGEKFYFNDDTSASSMRCLAYRRGESSGMKFRVSKVDRTVERIA